MLQISVARGAAALLAIALSLSLPAIAQQPPQAPESKPEAPAPQPTKQEKENPLGPLGPPPSTKTDYASQVVLEARYWIVKSNPLVRKNGGDPPSIFSFKDDIGGNVNNQRPWILLGIPTKHGNRLWFSYFETTFSGGGVSDRALTYFDQSYEAQTLLDSHVKMRNFKMSWEYLTYPAPPHAMKKWQFKTLWEVQAISIAPTITSTILSQLSDGTIIDTGNTTEKSKLMILPTLGVGIDTQPFKGVDFMAKGSGFILPNHKYIYDAEARLGIKVKKLEVGLGYRILSGSMGNNTEQYFRARMSGPYAGLAWHF